MGLRFKCGSTLTVTARIQSQPPDPPESPALVDVLGLILAVVVTGANVQDHDGGQLVLKGLKDRFPRLARVWADGVYAGRLVDWAEKMAQFVLDIVCKPKGQIAFSVLPSRWIVPVWV